MQLAPRPVRLATKSRWVPFAWHGAVGAAVVAISATMTHAAGTQIEARPPALALDAAQTGHRNERSTPRDAVLPRFPVGSRHGPSTPSADAVRLAKAMLMQRGHYVGRLDGRVTAKFKAALFRHQRANGLLTTGSLDPSTRRSLGIERP